MVQFLPLDVTDEDSVGVVLSHLDNAIQYGEHEEPKEPADVRSSLVLVALPFALRAGRRAILTSSRALIRFDSLVQMDNGDFDTGE